MVEISAFSLVDDSDLSFCILVGGGLSGKTSGKRSFCPSFLPLSLAVQSEEGFLAVFGVTGIFAGATIGFVRLTISGLKVFLLVVVIILLVVVVVDVVVVGGLVVVVLSDVNIPKSSSISPAGQGSTHRQVQGPTGPT